MNNTDIQYNCTSKMLSRTIFISMMVLAIGQRPHFTNRSFRNNEKNDTNKIIEKKLSTAQISKAEKNINKNYYMLPEFEEKLDNSQRKRLCKLLSWSNLQKWDFNIFDVVDATNGESPLLFVSWAILGSPYSQHSMAQACNSQEREEITANDTTTLKEMEGYNFFDDDSSLSLSSEFHLSSNSMKKLFNFLREMESDYHPENPYHNSIHAADVLQSAHSMIQQAGEDTNTGFEPSKEDVFSVLVAAAVHDVGHPGLNNAFHINAQTDIAQSFKNVSVLENYHASHALTKMVGRTNDEQSFQSHDNIDTDFNFLSDASMQEFTSIRNKMVDSILMTDMSKHFKFVKEVEDLIKNRDSVSPTTYSWTIFRYMLHLADISNPAKAQPLSARWAKIVMNEFFNQGDMEAKMGLPISPLCDRNTTVIPGSQIGFIEYVIKPSFEVLALAIPTIGENTLPVIENNLKYWNEKAATSAKIS